MGHLPMQTDKQSPSPPPSPRLRVDMLDAAPPSGYPPEQLSAIKNEILSAAEVTFFKIIRRKDIRIGIDTYEHWYSIGDGWLRFAPSELLDYPLEPWFRQQWNQVTDLMTKQEAIAILGFVFVHLPTD